MSTIGTDAWTQNMIKAAMDNRTNQLNPNHPAYWSSRNCMPPKKQANPFVAAALAATVGAAVAAVTLWGVQKVVKLKRAAEEEIEKAPELEMIEIEESESESETEEK